MNDPAELDPILVPMPRVVRRTGGWARVEGGEAVHVAERAVSGAAGVPPQGYRLRVLADGQGLVQAEIDAADEAGVRHGQATLAQLCKQYPERMPTLEIEDAPAFATRGVMLDVSRCRVPTMEQLYETVDLLASLKFNHLQLYTEHTFAYAGHEGVWRDWSAVTADDVRRLDAYCAARGVELAANQNCFGHLRQWLERPEYAHLAETHGEWMFDVWARKGAFSLCPTDPRSVEFVEGLLSQLLACFRGGLVNIGCDETYDIAYGRSAEEVSRRGRGVVYAEFVAKIVEAARRHGKRSMFWGDIALSDPACLARVPGDAIALAWGYEPDSAFERWGSTLRALGREFWVCPGTSSWRSLTGRTTERRGNLAAAAKAGVAHGAGGILVCDWGDTGHWQTWAITMHALTDAAQAAWNPSAAFDARASSLHVFGERSLRVGEWLEEFGDADLSLRETCGALSRPDRVRLANQSAIFLDLFKRDDEQREVGAVGAWRSAFDRLQELAHSTPTGMGRIDDELALSTAMAGFAAWRGWARRVGGGEYHAAARARARERWDALALEHARLWRRRSREGGLAQSLVFFAHVRGNILE